MAEVSLCCRDLGICAQVCGGKFGADGRNPVVNVVAGGLVTNGASIGGICTAHG